ncbi:flagellar biosynthesis protein FlhB [Limisalsivibrio acetivorans]|uniref:flagellar biosynthesis protein FlhB n=1 Tax=Limisalsivibrio acetivorans TaxID=1304888 RepID=UPI0003B2E599|nr:flagellar biosynthesis protein FlhB [Limisalsivibrio acetivorans]
MADNDSEKTEDPTSRRIRQAREEGNVPKTRELSSAIMFLAMAMFMYSYLPKMGVELMRYMREAMRSLDYGLDIQSTVELLIFSLFFMGKLLAPIMFLLLVISIVSNNLQFGFLFTPKALAIKWERLDPVKGLGKLFSKKSLVELFKSLFKIFVIGFVAYTIVNGKIPTILRLSDSDPMDTVIFFLLLIFELFLKVGILVLLMAIADLFYQKWQNKEDLKMTKTEVKEEHKQMEGDPLVKQKIRSLQKEMARKRMMEDVPKSDVVVTNPTHYAVALRYTPGEDRAPVVLAKGQRLIALRIREMARENGVLVHEDPPLARTLFKTVDIGDEIPENLYKAVAEILSLVDKYRTAN